MRWKKTIRIKHLIESATNDSEGAISCAKAISKALGPEDVPAEITDRFNRVLSIGSLDAALECLYDYCDCNAIWVD